MRRRRKPNRTRQPAMLDPTAFRRPARHRARRRRRPWIVMIGLGVLVIAVLVTSAGSHVGTRPSSSSPAGHAAPPRHHASTASVKLQAAREAAAARAVLRYTPLVRGGTGHKREIALTFDDGPSPYTFKVINVLERMRVPGTFFIVGQHVPQFPGGLRSEIDHGFPVGDHTEDHAGLRGMSSTGQYAQIHTAAIRAEHVGAPAPSLFRPPYGVYDAQTIRTLRSMRMLMVLWSVDTGDWRRPGTPAIVRQALSGATPGGIILMHDGGGDRSQTVAALPAIINGLRRRHYRLVTVPHLLVVDPPPRHQRLP